MHPWDVRLIKNRAVDEVKGQGVPGAQNIIQNPNMISNLMHNLIKIEGCGRIQTHDP